MSAIQAKRSFGRTWFIMSMLNLMRSSNPITTNPFSPVSEEAEGFDLQSQSFYRDNVKKIFRYGKFGAVIPVGNNNFTVTTIHGTVFIEGGIIDMVYLSSFPYMTQVTVHKITGPVLYNNAGNPKIK